MTPKPFDFSHYYTYKEITAFLQEIAVAYPQLVQLQTIGKSYEDREIWLAIVMNQATGNYQEKPGYWVDANTHAGEVTGSAVALYLLHKLVSQSEQNPQITRLLNHHTVYILPRLAVDGAEKYLTTPYSLRSSVRPYPDPEPQEGLHEEDINGDGLILQMRMTDDCGAWKIWDQDSRVMVRRQPEEFGGTYYTLLPEGQIINDNGYEFKVAAPLEGLDFNRNYPYLWEPEGQQKGAGDFPFSEPETEALAQFWRHHRNINGFITYHTYSGVILRPYATHGDDHFPVEDLEIYKQLGEKGKALTGYDCISVFHDFRYHPKDQETGVMDDYGYDHWGWFGLTIELWDAPTAAGVEKQDYIRWLGDHPPEDDAKLLQWNDQVLGGTGFVDWQPFDHPQLGTVEIGGWNHKVVWRNAPIQYLPELCEQQANFAIAHGLMSPHLAISRIDLTPQGADVYHLAIQLENQGFLPTYTSQKALERKAVKPIKVQLFLPEGITLVSGLQDQEIAHLQGRSNKALATVAAGMDYRCHLEWVLKGVTQEEVRVAVCSERAGTVRTKLKLNDSGSHIG